MGSSKDLKLKEPREEKEDLTPFPIDKHYLFINTETMRKGDPEFNKLLNEFNMPTLESHLSNIFAVNGVILVNGDSKYHLHAQAFLSAFILRVSRISNRENKRPLDLNLGISDLLNKSWEDNEKIPKHIKKILDRIWSRWVYPKTRFFKLALERPKFAKEISPLTFQRFIMAKNQRIKTFKKVFCPKDQKEQSVGYCFAQCPDYVSHDQEIVICRKIIVIHK